MNIARVNRLIGQPMAEASLSSSPFLYRRPFFSRRRHCLASLLASSPVRHHVCTREGKGVTTSEERALAGTSSSFVIVRNRDTAFFHGIFSPSMSTNLGEINQRSKKCNLDLDGTPRYLFDACELRLSGLD